MIANISFLLFFSIFLIVVIGYGRLFSSIFFPSFLTLNYGFQGFIGIFTLSFIAMLTSFFFAHAFLHNLLILILGLFGFVLKMDKNYFKKNIRLLLIISLCLIIGLYVFKNHDDFPYYHLPYALTLVENNFILGMGNLGHGFRTPSSIFYFNSLLYLPIIKYYLFHSQGLFILIFFNIIFLDKILLNLKTRNYDFFYFLYLMIFIFVNCVFYRLSEFGADRSGQILIFIIFLKFFEIINLDLSREDFENSIMFMMLMTILAASMKAYFFIYFIVPLVLFLNKRQIYSFMKIKFLKIFLLITLFISMIISINFLSTGCMLYPAQSTCIDNLEWSIKKKEVKKMKTHYEWWAKAGGGSNYSINQKKEDYVKNFNWVKNWIDKYFFNKVSDFLLGIIFIMLFVRSILYTKNKKENKKKIKYFLPLALSVIFLLEWFFIHPALRYGGYVLISLTIFIIFSLYLSKFDYSKKNVNKLTIFLIIITFAVYNGRNILRLNYEITKYDYKILSSPFFDIPDIGFTINYKDKDKVIYKPIDNMCWSTPTPCSHRSGIKMININNFKVIVRK